MRDKVLRKKMADRNGAAGAKSSDESLSKLVLISQPLSYLFVNSKVTPGLIPRGL
jgi:hypothetical protein